MPNIAVMLKSKLNIFSRKRNFMHLPIENNELEWIESQTRDSKIERKTKSSKRKLQSGNGAIIEDNSTHYTRSSRHAMVTKELWKVMSNHQQRKEKERSDESKDMMKSTATEWQINVKRLKFLKRKIELARRKRIESQGSFANNMVTYRDGKSKYGLERNKKGKGESDSTSRSSGQDDRSQSSNSTCQTKDVTLHVIEEEMTYYEI